MLSSFTLVALSALSSTVVAQYTLPDGFDPSLADPNDKGTFYSRPVLPRCHRLCGECAIARETAVYNVPSRLVFYRASLYMG